MPSKACEIAETAMLDSHTDSRVSKAQEVLSKLR